MSRAPIAHKSRLKAGESGTLDRHVEEQRLAHCHPSSTKLQPRLPTCLTLHQQRHQRRRTKLCSGSYLDRAK